MGLDGTGTKDLTTMCFPRHMTPRYVASRLREACYRRTTGRDLPWLTPAANGVLASWLRKDDVVVEFGSGRSTRWFAGRVGRVVSIDHHKAWYETVSRQLANAGIDNVDYHFAETAGLAEKKAIENYLAPVKGMKPETVDMVLSDGQFRDHCAKRGMELLKPGGLLVVDNANWFLPCASHAPASRTEETGCSTPLWTELSKELAGWRTIWTSNGVTDTALFVKP